MRIRLVAHLAAALATCACVAPNHFICPARGGPEWRELQGEHFVVRTDLDHKAATAVLDELETLRTVFLTSMFDRPVSLADRLEVIVLASSGEYDQITRRPTTGGFFSHDALGRERIVLLGGLGPSQAPVVAHELTHRLAYQFLPRQPRWFSEGIALYFQTAAETLGARRRLGTLPGRWLAPLREGPLPVRKVLTWRKEEGEEDRYYATSWLLVHYLMNARLDHFAAFQRRLARAEEPQLVWNATFPEWSLEGTGTAEELDALLRAHMKSTTWGFIEVDAPRVETHASERILSAPEVHSITLDVGVRRPRGERLAEAREALAEDPGQVAALQVLAERDPALGPELARRAVASHGDDPRAWSFLADAMRVPGAADRRLEARRRAAEHDPEHADWRVRLAHELLAAGHPADAEREASRAVRVAPWSGMALYLDAAALLSMGRCAEGIPVLRRAIDVMATNLTAEEVARNAAVYDRLAERCAKPELHAADVLAIRASMLLDQGEEGLAARLLGEAVARDPEHRDAWGMLGVAELQLGHVAAARRALQRQLQLVPEHRSALRELARADREVHRLDDAEATLRKILAGSPPPGWARTRLIYLLLDRDRPAEALAELDRGRPTPDDAWAWFIRGRAHLLLHQPSKGMDELERSVKLLPGDPELLDLAARALAESDLDRERAAAWARQSGLARTRAAASVLPDAFGPDQAFATGDLVESWITAGLIALRGDAIEEAERLLSAAERLGARAEASAWLAQVLDRAGRAEEAARARARAVAIAPELRDAQRRLAALGDAGARVSAGRSDLARTRSLPLPAGSSVPGGRDLLVALAADGTIARIVSRDGEPLPDGVAALRGKVHGIALPADAPALLVVPASTACGPGGCAVVLGPPLEDPAPSP